MALKITNNATSKLAAAIGTADTTLSLTPGEGAKFPTLAADDWFPVTAIKSDGTLEIMKCTARATDTLTVSRAQENTGAMAFSSGDRIELRMTAAAFNQFVTTNASGGITVPNAGIIMSKDAGGTLRELIYMSADDHPTLVVSTGTHLRIMNQAQDTELFTCDNSGNIDAAGNATVAGNETVTGNITVGGNATVTGIITGSNVTATSDENLKKDWASVAPDFLDLLAQVLAGSYTRIDTGERQAGVSAQSLARALPEAVIENADGTLSVAYGHAALVAVIELTKEVLSLRSRLEVKI
jgi:hypothetical protein